MDTDLSAADASFWGEDADDKSGESVAGAGDVNGDGYDDILIGADGDEDGGSLAGQTYLILGKASGWAKDTDLSAADASFWGEDAGDHSGRSVAGAGDVNGDGFDDILIGAWGDDDGGADAGQTYLILGKASGWEMDTDLSAADASFWGEDIGDHSGYSVAGAGDVNGDGFDDILIGAYGDEDGGSEAGQTYLIFGKASGWEMDSDLSNADASFRGEDLDDYSGRSVAGAGDVNGDGYDDILIGADGDEDGGSLAGQTYLMLGKASGWAMDTGLSNADVSFWGEDGGDRSGYSVAGAGDVNGDGYDDILIGANQDSDGGSLAGQIYLIFPDMNSQPTTVSSVKAYSDNSFSQEISKAQVNDTIFIELQGTDGNSSRKDIAITLVNNSNDYPDGVRLRLMETGMNTGIYRGDFTIKNRTHEEHRWINASWGDKIWVSSLQDPSKNATIHVEYPIITLLPLKDDHFAQEDVEYKVHYWVTGGSDLEWTFETNASWLEWNETAQNLSGIPDNEDVGFYWVRLNVSSEVGGSDEQNFTLTVNNTPPGIIMANITSAVEDLPYSADFNSTDDGQGLVTWHLKSDAGIWLSIDPVTGVISGTPNNDNIGQHFINVSVDDGNGGQDSMNRTLTVINTNDPPEIIGIDITEIDEDIEYVSNYSVNDVDKTDTVFVWDLVSNASWLNIDTTTGRISGLPDNDDVGSYLVNVTVKDPAETMDFRNFTLTVKNVNDPPVWTSVPENVTINDTDTYTFDVNASDIDVGTILKYNISSTPISAISIDPETGMIIWKPNTAGTYIVNVSVSDTNVTLHHLFQIIAVHVNTNSPPECTLTLPENGSKIEVLNPTLIWSISDEDDVNVTSDLYLSKDITLVKNLDVLSNIASRLNTTYYTPTDALEKGATYYWTIRPYDGSIQGKCVSGIWSFSISEAASMNHLPKFVSDPALDAGVGVEWTYTPWATDEDNGDSVFFKLPIKPNGMVLLAGVINWTPTANQLGNHKVKLEASDGKGSAFQEFQIYVSTAAPSNHAPQISPVSPVYAKAGDRISIHITANDEEDDTIIFSIVGDRPSGLEISDTGQLTWTTRKGDEGIYGIVIKVSDGKLSTTNVVTIHVEKYPSPPRSLWADLMPIILLIVVIIALIAVAIVVWRIRTRPSPSEHPPQATSVVIDDVFLIYRDGRLISHNTRKLKPEMDDDVLGGMFTAVQEFIKTSFGGDDESPVDEISYGNNKILIEHGRYIFISAVIEGQSSDVMHERMKTAVHNIEVEFEEGLKDWSGDTKDLKGAKKWLIVLISGEPIERLIGPEEGVPTQLDQFNDEPE